MRSQPSSSDRALRLRRRADLDCRRQRYQGRSYWVVKDPLTLKYYRFQEEEFFLLQQLDGAASLDRIRRRFERRFPPQKLSAAELSAFIAQLHKSGIVISDAPRQGDELLARRAENSRRELLGRASNILSLRWRGFDPDRLLGALNGCVGWLFSPAIIVICLLFCAAAAGLIVVQLDEFYARLPAFDRFFAAENWLWLAVAISLTKVLHELGHGLACKRLGGECHEMGVMLLVLSPCLYVNVSDSWMLPSKWQRAAIAAAGMYVELVLASACALVWWFTEPGLLNYICLNVMFVSSVSTVMFNANPLLRYDGYYILSDLIEIPNLRTKASAVLRRKLGRWVLGLEEPDDPFLPERRQWLFAGYTVAAAAYRWFICLSILWFLYNVFKPYGLQVIGQLIAAASLYSLAVHPLWQLVRFFHVPGRIEKVNKLRAAAALAGLAVAATAVLAVPLPYHVECPFRVEARDAAPVYVDVAGRLEAIHTASGRRVQAGQPLASLDNIDVRLALARMAGEREGLIARVEDLRRRQFHSEEAALQLAEAEQSLAAAQQQLARLTDQQRRLSVTAPTAGTILPPPRGQTEAQRPGELPTWRGSPLEEQNLGAALEAGVLLCRVGDPHRLTAVLDIDQTQIEFVRPGQKLRLRFDALPADRFRSEVLEVAQLERDATASERKAAAAPTAQGRAKALTTKYQAKAALDDVEGLLFPGATGVARIHAGRRTLAQRLWRQLCHTFRFAA